MDAVLTCVASLKCKPLWPRVPRLCFGKACRIVSRQTRRRGGRGRKRAPVSLTEKELEVLCESEARSRIVVETLADAVINIDESSVIRYANPAAARIFGYEPGELVGMRMTALMPDYLRRLHEEGISRYVETGGKHISWEGV